MLKSLKDLRAVQWVVDGLAPFEEFCVGSLAPRGFDRYARIDHAPEDGWLPDVVSIPLKGVLRPHTPAGASCCLGVWRGWGATYNADVPKTGFVSTGPREWDLFCGPVDALDFRFFADFEATVNVAWSKDRAWFLCTDIDLDRTFVGCNGSVFGELLSDDHLSAAEVRLEDPLGSPGGWRN